MAELDGPSRSRSQRWVEARGQVDGRPLDTSTLAAAARAFARFPTPWLLLVGISVPLVVHTAIAPWRWTDLLVLAALVSVQPFSEWVIHVTILHSKPLRLGRLRWDMFAAVEHRRHHADPRNVAGSLIPLRVLAYAAAIAVASSLLWPTPGMRQTSMAVMGLQALLYEWCHFLIHSDYKPKRAFYRKLYQAHRLHHYRNEHYWFGVSRTFGDRVLGTAPDKDSVPVSSTVKRLLESVTAGT